ncbi:CoA pyrophosphatase [Marinimicrobium sp. ABcell2]|uniref:NUDIX hydrolase n=1 Tax=Marinimicrobium sp. ABcell2 TaxID=3069751 RepID=UPI0027B81110|nr:CoA pyrophosphatase [Marinimicrobium sp. ABcell2]MDQ2075465.1 CoA pyrophosphatase [Marinimicrobium sp. ABcell2]
MSPFVERLLPILYPTHALTDSPGLFPEQAAVMVLITDHPTRPELIYTLRAQHMRQHAGEVAFPGGKWEPQDPDLLTTALRETHEEVDLPPAQIRLLGAFKPSATRAGTKVTPFVGLVAHSVALTPNPNELESVFRVPLGWFTPENCLRVDEFRRAGKVYRVPAYGYGEYEIWGFTAALTQEILAATK